MIDYLLSLGQSTSMEVVWKRHCDEMAGFGFDRLLYGYTRFLVDVMHGELDQAVFLSNHDRAYLDRFITGKMFLDAPLTRWASEVRGGACSWGTIWSDPEELSETEREVIAFNQSMDVAAGYSISFADANPRALGMIALTARADMSQAEIDAVWAEHGRQIEAMNNVFHLKALTLPHPTTRALLSDRQREVLEWVGVGKSNLDIATILGVSVPTVEKHLRLARDKLGVETTAQAVLKASYQNQIYVI